MIAAPAKPAIGFDGRMPDLTGRSAVAAVDLIVDHQPAANAGADLDVCQAVIPLADPPPFFSDGACIGVIFHVNGQMHRLADLLRRTDAFPGGHVVGQECPLLLHHSAAQGWSGRPRGHLLRGRCSAG